MAIKIYGKKWLFVLPAVSASFFAAAGMVTTQCSDGALTVKLGVLSGESCTVNQNVTINGVSDLTTLSITEDTTNTFKLEATDSASASVQMSCASSSGSSSASASVSTDSGCS